MKTISFVTSNPGKITSLQSILEEISADISIEMLRANYPEDKSNGSLQHVALSGAQYCANAFNKSVLVTDTGIFIDALNGFPGINTAYTLDRIGTEGILALLKEKTNRAATWELSLGYCEPGIQPVQFTALLPGTIATQAEGEYGFGFDQIYIPEGFTETLAQQPGIDLRDKVTPFRQAVIDFANWYKDDK